MRPLKLTIKGFRSHREGTNLDFRGRGLVGVVGPIGSGKSSILDGIAFALFAQTPAAGAATKSLIHQQAASAHVDFWFESDGAVWRVVRALRRQGQAAHTLSRFSQVDDDGESIESFVLKTEVDTKIQELLGMEFPAFSRSIMLAQGRFAQLLQATPTEANKVLQSVFGFEQIPRMREVASSRVVTAQAQIAALGDEAQKIQAARGRLTEAQAEAEAASLQHEAMATLEPKVAAVSALQVKLTARNEELGADALVLDNAVSALPIDAAAVVVAEGAREASATEALEAVAEARKAMAEADLDRMALVDAGAEATLGVAEVLTSQRLEAVEALVAAEPLISAGEARLAKAQEAARDAEEAVVRSRSASLTASAGLAEAESGLVALRTKAEEARRDHAAHDLRSHLAPGEACPVCEQHVKVVPGAGDAEGLSVAEANLAAGRTALVSMQGATSEASATESEVVQTLAERVKAADTAQRALAGDIQRVSDLRSAVGAFDKQLEDRLGVGDPAELFSTLKSKWDQAQELYQTAERLVNDAEATHNQAIAEGSEAAERFESLRTAILLVSDRLGLEQPPLESSARVTAALGEIDGVVATRKTALSEEQESVTSSMGESVVELTALLEAAGVPTSSAFAEAVVSSKAEMLRHTTTVKVMEDALAGGGDIVDRLAEAEAGLEIYQALAKDLNPSRFLAFMLDEERAKLVAVSSVKLAELSGGRYGFALSEKGDIEMIDNTAVEYRRATSSLSGGETFLASLALALGLADMVAGGVGTLDAFFLDEGFGSLDAEHLDLAMEGIEQLVNASPDRLVVVVSHVAELRERVEDLIVLDRNPDTGVSILVSGAEGPTG